MDKAQEWRAKSRALTIAEAGTIVDLALPSGMVIKARRPSPGFIAGLGRLPLSLATAAAGAADETPRASEDVAEFFTFLRELLLFCVVEPAISLTPGPGEIHPREVAEKDVQFIFHWAMRGSEAGSLESFRSQSADGSAGSRRAEVPPAPVRAVGDRRSAGSAKFRPRSDSRPKSTR